MPNPKPRNEGGGSGGFDFVVDTRYRAELDDLAYEDDLPQGPRFVLSIRLPYESATNTTPHSAALGGKRLATTSELLEEYTGLKLHEAKTLWDGREKGRTLLVLKCLLRVNHRIRCTSNLRYAVAHLST